MNQIELFEKERATYYDDFVVSWIINYDFVINALPKIITIEAPNANNILVAGCGTGNEILSLSNYNASWNITGIDPSIDMIAQAKSKLLNTPRTKIIQGTVDTLPITKKYEVATLFLVLHFMKGDTAKEHLLQSIADRLKKGGLFVLLDIFGTKKEFAKNCQLLEKLLPAELEGMIIKERIASMPERIFPISEKKLSKLLKKVGFSTPIRYFQSSIYGGWIIKKL